MKRKDKHFKLINENLIPSNEAEMEELDGMEEDMKIYKWLSIMLGIVWILSLLVY